MASFPRDKKDSSTQTDPPPPFTALLDRSLDRIEATVPLNLSSITFYIRRHHLSRIEQVEVLLSKNFIFLVLFRIGLKPHHVFSALCLLTLYGCRQLYRKSVYLTTNLCAVAYPAYCSIRTINSEPISPPSGLGLEPTEYNLPYGPRRSNSFYSNSGSIRSNRRRSRRRMSNMADDSMQSGSNSFSGSSSSQEDYESSRRSVLSSSWERPSEYSNYSEDNITTTSGGSGAVNVEEKMKQRMRRRWAKFSHTYKEKATRQWLAYWSIYGTVQVVDTWSSFLLDWIPGYNLGKLLFLWWAQHRGATLIFDYFQPLIQAKNKEGREVARKPSNRSLRSEYSRHERGGGSPSQAGSSRGGSRPASIQILPSVMAQHQQQQQQYQQQQFGQQFFGRGGTSRRDTASTRDSNQGRRRRDDYHEDDEEDIEDLHNHLIKQGIHRQQQKKHQPMDLHRELMASSPHDSGSFAETSLFESVESVWNAPPMTASPQAVDEISSAGAAFHSNNATPTPMSVHEQYQRQHQLHRQSPQKQPSVSLPDPSSYEGSSTNHWNPSASSSTTEE